MMPQRLLRDDSRLLSLALRAARTPAEDTELRALHRRLGDGFVQQLARTNQVGALVGHALRQVLPDAELDQAWTTLLDRNRDRVSRLIEALASVCRRLDAEGIASATIEAGGVMLATELPPEAYCPGDIDLLVAPGHNDVIARIMRELGFAPDERAGRVRTSRREFMRRDREHELRLDLGPVVFERRYLPLSFQVPSEDWLNRRVLCAAHGDISVLESKDLLLQVALHTSMHHFVMAPGLRLLIDVDRAAQAPGLDWSEFDRSVTDIGVSRRAWASLALASFVLSTQIPLSTLDLLKPPYMTVQALNILLRRSSISRSRLLQNPLSSLMIDFLVDDNSSLHWPARVVGHSLKRVIRSDA